MEKKRYEVAVREEKVSFREKKKKRKKNLDASLHTDGAALVWSDVE